MWHRRSYGHSHLERSSVHPDVVQMDGYTYGAFNGVYNMHNKTHAVDNIVKYSTEGIS